MPFAAGDVTTAQALNRAVPLKVVLTSNHSKASDTTLSSTALTLTVEANRRYAFHVWLHYQGTSTGDLRIGFSIPTSATMAYEPNTLESSAASLTGATYRGIFTATSGAIGGSVGTSSPAGADIFGQLTTGANAGSFTFQFGQGTSDATATTLVAGSWMQLLDIT